MQSEILAYYREIRKENKKIMKRLETKEKKLDREDVMRLLKYYINFELMGEEVTHFDNSIPSDC
jgi:hypothetical protein